ncbi:flagellar biosynthesis protein FlhB [Serpentinicella sp. ANB-PHB4]|uniref:flagellar biosynthesis protein FlhB n=1 Tax=Serpentinicella sp. ANB-PHB4 TaxID=3074076 RepID=UPI002863F5C1|nr:flagellar biosynthesis protein FlhB [Serpentinicella sp. ANB-PHB4]MDR5658251.1 flagellar biosynthesis protein FlhB [Serpentinicella sp. ANB-PHB4]
MEFIINLQLFSEEKTEKPTPKKRKESREEGQVLQSKEINSALVLLGAFASLYLFSNFIGSSMKSFTVLLYENYLSVNYEFSQGAINRIYMMTILNMFKIVLPIGMLCLVIGVLSSYVQVGYLFTLKPLKPKLSKLNPIQGFKKLFSMKSLIELIKSILKIILVGFFVYRYAINNISTIMSLIGTEIQISINTIINVTTNIAMRAGAALIAIAIIDYLFQKYDYEKNLKMSKHEIKQEHKQTEGNPEIKSKIKEKQRQMSMSRMMQEIPKADVIITNPTHFAVAIIYNPKEFSAPRVVAKGQDLIAQNIKKIAGEHSIPVVENKPLARTLYSVVDIGDSIPPDLYESVAEVLAYVYQLNETR